MKEQVRSNSLTEIDLERGPAALISEDQSKEKKKRKNSLIISENSDLIDKLIDFHDEVHPAA